MIPNMMCSIWAHHLSSYSEHSLAVRQSEISDLLNKKAQETTEWPQVQPVYFMSPLNISVLDLV